MLIRGNWSNEGNFKDNKKIKYRPVDWLFKMHELACTIQKIK